MGGIAGIVHFHGKAPLLAQAHQLSAGIAHRGPDDRGVFAEGPIALVHRRFAGSASDRKGPLKNDTWVDTPRTVGDTDNGQPQHVGR